jgi:hypothetical protein
MLDFSKIYEGWRNKIIPPAHLKEFINLTGKQRMEICLQCEHHSENAKEKGYKTLRPDAHCVDCGCTLSAKTKCLSCMCPIEKWMDVLSEEQEDKLKKDINYGQEK